MEEFDRFARLSTENAIGRARRKSLGGKCELDVSPLVFVRQQPCFDGLWQMRLVAHRRGLDLCQRLASEFRIFAGAMLFDEEVPDPRRADPQRLLEIRFCLSVHGFRGRRLCGRQGGLDLRRGRFRSEIEFERKR
ncbi:hypothetical protein D9M70_507640 [compost metagenome]